MRHAPLLLLLLALLVPRPLLAAERVGIRVGDHAGHGRLVFDWAAAPPYAVEQQGDRVRVRFGAPAEIDLAGARRLPRNVVAIERVPEGVALTLRPGARLRHFRNGARVAFDALDPSPEEPPSAAAAPAAPQAGASPPAAVLPQPNVPAAARAAAELAAAPPPRSAPAAPAPRGAPAAPAPRGAPEARRDATPPAPRAVATAVSPAQPSAPAASGPPASARVPAPAPPAAPPPRSFAF